MRFFEVCVYLSVGLNVGIQVSKGQCLLGWDKVLGVDQIVPFEGDTLGRICTLVEVILRIELFEIGVDF